MFVLKRESRNQTDQLSGKQFESNYLRIFGLRLPIMDTVHVFLKNLAPKKLEVLRELLIRRLMERKVFEKWKYQGYYNLSIDATGLFSFEEKPFENCTYKETKNGIRWYVNVLEAKLVFSNGMSLSLDSEWLINENGTFDKQDCEQKAFKRLAARIKDKYPRLAIMVSADSLYCSDPIFEIIKRYNWKFIFTFKEGVLKNLWKLIHISNPEMIEKVIARDVQSKQWIMERISFLNGLSYKSHQVNYLNYLSYDSQGKLLERHVHLTNLSIDSKTGFKISLQGRMRWTIENQGFNTQKNQGYKAHHKYARKGFHLMQNYYLLMQIAHLINQLVEKLQHTTQELNKAKRSLKSFIEDAVASLKKINLSFKEIFQFYLQHKQLRY